MDYTEVERQEPPAGQLRGGGTPVRQSGAHAGGNDGLKGHAFSATNARLVFEFGGNFDLGDSGPNDAQDVLEERAAL